MPTENPQKTYQLVKRSLANELISSYASYQAAAKELRKLDDRFFIQGPRIAYFFDDVQLKRKGAE